MPLARAYAAHGHGGGSAGHGRSGSFGSKGPFQTLTGQFIYDYTRYGAIGKNWESDSTAKMPNAAVNAYAVSATGQGGNCPSVRFRVWFLGPMKSDHPKCAFEIAGGGRVENILKATRYHADVIALPETTCDTQTHDFSIPESDAPWTVRFHCTSQ
jgi:hypothetical protein